jgi:hypothetical protein
MSQRKTGADRLLYYIGWDMILSGLSPKHSTDTVPSINHFCASASPASWPWQPSRKSYEK